MRTWQCTQCGAEQDQNKDECKFLELVPRHKCEEPEDSAIQTDKGEEEEEENHYEPKGSKDELE